MPNLIRALHGHVPRAILCVDLAGCIRAAALPAGIPAEGALLEGRALQEFVRISQEQHAHWQADLASVGSARVSLRLPLEEYEQEIEADVLLVSGPAPELEIDITGRVRRVNAAAQELLGWSERGIHGRSFASLIEDVRQARSFKLGLSGGKCEPTRLALRCKDGRTLTVDLRTRPVATPSSEPRGWTLVVRETDAPADVGASRTEELERHIRSVTHDLRSPLGSLRAFAELLERDFGPRMDELGQHYLERLRSSADRIQNLFEDLLEDLRIRHVEREQHFIAPREVLEQLAAELKPDLERGQIHLDLPVDPEPVYANPRRFRQVVLNLVLNAVQHMGNVESPEIRIEAESQLTGTVITVRDNGLGIPPDKHVRIFELFAHASGERDWRGRGLGLSIVKRIMSAHGGRIEIDSKPGSGASFRAFFPNPVGTRRSVA